MTSWRAISILLITWGIGILLSILWAWFQWETGGLNRSQLILIMMSWISLIYVPPFAAITGIIITEKQANLKNQIVNTKIFIFNLLIMMVIPMIIIYTIAKKVQGFMSFDEAQTFASIILIPLIGILIINLNLMKKKMKI